jgi:hypothetical protein
MRNDKDQPLRNSGHIRVRAYPKDEIAVFEAAKLFLQSEG